MKGAVGEIFRFDAIMLIQKIKECYPPLLKSLDYITLYNEIICFE